MSGPKMRRQIPDWVIATMITLLVAAMVAGLVWGIVVLIRSVTDREPGPAQVDVSWQCTEFGDRLYWPTDASRRTFAVVPGGCRT
jgi:hypothetical protein